MSDVVIAGRIGPALQLGINRPERRNALNAEVVAGLHDGFDAAEADPEVRAIVLTGTGERAFCAGGDLQPTASGAPFAVDHADPTNFVAAFLRRVSNCRLPVIARVNGAAMAGGLGLVCACDLAIASTTAVFGVPEVKVGLFPMMILPVMQRVLNRRKLLELCITGNTLTAGEALRLGLLNDVVAPEALNARIDHLLAQIEAASPTAIRLGKMGFRAMQDMNLDQALDYAQLMLPNMAQTTDAAEGFAAFREKRPPQWSGR